MLAPLPLDVGRITWMPAGVETMAGSARIGGILGRTMRAGMNPPASQLQILPISPAAPLRQG